MHTYAFIDVHILSSAHFARPPGSQAERWRRGMGFDFELTNAEDKPEVLMAPWHKDVCNFC
jgi:hypothetical protein